MLGTGGGRRGCKIRYIWANEKRWYPELVKTRSRSVIKLEIPPAAMTQRNEMNVLRKNNR